jgi:hypothetical protein
MTLLELFIQAFVSRTDDFALQRSDGGYVRVGRPVTIADVHGHLTGQHTIGSYVIDEHGCCKYAVFDADREDGLDALRGVQSQLETSGIASYLEQSRRGAHLWVFLAAPTLASAARAWLLPSCPSGIEFYPKQDEGRGYGSVIRLPLGVHRLSGKRYPFVALEPAGAVPVARSVHTSLLWVASLQRVAAPPGATRPNAQARPTNTPQEKSFSTAPLATKLAPTMTIRAWCALQDPYAIIGRYVALNSRGQGCCPFGWHHANGRDAHASFKVYSPGVPGGYSWFCHAWGQGGSVFDFLRYYHNLDARILWQRIQAGGVV